MNNISWNQFEIKNSNPRDAFETMCRHIFLRQYKVSSHAFSANYNQTGLETEPISFDGKYYGFQCKYSTSGNGDALYKEVYDSLKKAVATYPHINTIIVYTNLDIKPNVTEEELASTTKSNRIKIARLVRDKGIKIIWFLKANFESALNEDSNYDLYRAFFSSQDTNGLLNSAITYDERTFLTSLQFIDLSVNGTRFSLLQDEILSNQLSIVTGAAGTGKSELLKKLYLKAEAKYKSSFKQTPAPCDIQIPVLIRLRDCIKGNLESLLRDRLNDFGISIANNQNPYMIFLDGVDEVSTIDFHSVMSFILHHTTNNHNSFILSSRLNTPNLTMILRDLETKVYTIDDLKTADVELYFRSLNNAEKSKKLIDIKSTNPAFLDDITDIFSAVLLSENITQIDDKTTKVDLIKLNVEQRIEKHSKLVLINLPEPKVLSITSILASVSKKMQRSGIISISRSELQKIIRNQFPNCSYLEVDHIIDVVCELFFDVSPSQDLLLRYSYKHKRYFEFYLYVAIKNEFYDNPSILRELKLLSNRDFILHIFLIQELKENTLSANLEKVLTLRFFEAYLGDVYMRGENSPWLSTEKFLVPSSESYAYSSELRRYLCTKQIEDFRDFIRIDPLHIKGYLTTDNYYDFVKEYHKTNGVDIRETLEDFYDFSEEQLLKAKYKNIYSYLYCKCMVDNVSISDVYNFICTMEHTVRNTDLDYYPSSETNSNFVIAFFALAIENFYDWLLSAIGKLSINHLEVLSYILLRQDNLKYIIKNDGKLSPLAQTLCDRIAQNKSESYENNTVVLYGILTKEIIQEASIQARAKKANINHYETWRNNIELNSYTLMLLDGKEVPYHHDFKLGISLRRIVHEFYSDNKNEILTAILTEINKYNLIYKNWFRYYNTCFIGEMLSTLDFTDTEIRQFIGELKKYRSVVNTFQVLYVIMSRNLPLFKTIANPSLISSEYLVASKDVSYYDYNSDLGYQYATMMSHFDIFKADALFENAVNNSIFRPVFRKEDMLDLHLPKCLLTAYENCWLSEEEMEINIRRTNSILKLAKETLDSGSYDAHFKYVVEKCCPYLEDIINDLSAVDSEEPNRLMGWESGHSTVVRDDLTIDNISQYYNCQKSGINYSSYSIWETLIKFEQSQDKELKMLYQTLDANYYPDSHFSKTSKCFPIITAILISDTQTRTKAADYIMKHAGRMGLVNIIKAFSLTGEDTSGRHCIEQLLKLCEAMVYPCSDCLTELHTYTNQNSQLVHTICNSKTSHWDIDPDNRKMTYMPDRKILIKWDSYEEERPFEEEWATNYPDRNARSINYYLYYGESLIKTFEMVYVDGYRALLPMPNYESKHIARTDYQFCCLLNNSIENLNDYIVRSKLVVD